MIHYPLPLHLWCYSSLFLCFCVFVEYLKQFQIKTLTRGLSEMGEGDILRARTPSEVCCFVGVHARSPVSS